MRTGLVVGCSAIVAAAIPIVLVFAWPRHHEVTTRRDLTDDRHKGPGIHRAGPAELAVLDRVAQRESAKVIARRNIKAASVPATTWVNLGPTDAPQEVNFYTIHGVDSGRPNSIVVDPRDGNVVYMAVSGGGVWKSFDFLSAAGPTWAPTMDTLPNLAVGAFALDPDHPDTLYVANGDFVDTSGDTVLKSADGGGTWSAPVKLSGTYPSGFVANVLSTRQIGVKGNLVLVGSDVGLFASNDAGATFQLVDLPNAGGALLAEGIWSVLSTGGTGWVVSGVTACSPTEAPPVFTGADPDPTNCPAGNNAAIWRSTDGVTWTLATTTPPQAGTGRLTLAVGPATDPATTVVYAFVGSVTGDHTVGYWRSPDGGTTFADATGTLANPTLATQDMDTSCVDIDVGHDQSWYNQAIVVDPTNADHVLVGGNLCGMRTLNGSAASPTWELVSHWLPGPDFGETANGHLPYVHADWHATTSVVSGGQVTIFAGTDGGLFSSPDVFSNAKAENVSWTHHNKGLTTHLMYSVASGDPASGDPFVAFSGLQDNGTRFRATPENPSAFNQPVGGDGIGTTVHHSTAGTVYWASVEFARVFCFPAAVDCSTEVDQAPDDATSHWHSAASPVGASMDDDEVDARMHVRAKKSGEDEEPFFIHYADVETDTTGESVLSHTDEQVFVSTPSAGGFVFTAISQDLTADAAGAGFANVTASRATPGLYGAAGIVSAQPFYTTTKGNTKTVWTIAKPVLPDGVNRLTGAASIDFPPTLPAGKVPGDVYIGSFTGTMNDVARTPPPDDKGHLWRTTDAGQTWTSIVGSDPAHQLPNVQVYVAKYDPITATTIYAGTQLGVYITIDDGATWNRMGDDFPMVPARDMYIAKNQDFIRVGTYGRGMWEIYPSAAANEGAPGNGDFDRNLVIDWIDLGAMSARLGETPTTTTAPLYSWILDMTGADADPPVQAIEDNDLIALITKFGGHP